MNTLKKVLISSFFCLSFIFIGCSSNSKKEENKEQTKQIEEVEVPQNNEELSDNQEEEEEDNSVKPPFTFKTRYDTKYVKILMEYTLLENGKGTRHYKKESYSDIYDWRVDEDSKTPIKWSTTVTGSGDSYQNVFEIKYQGNLLYLPDSFDYLFVGDESYLDMESNNTENAFKVEDFKKLD